MTHGHCSYRVKCDESNKFITFKSASQKTNFSLQDYAERVSCKPDLDYPCQRQTRMCRCAHFWVKGV